MRDLTEMLCSIIDDAKYKIARQIIKFYGKEYENRVFEKIDKTKTFFYHDKISANDLKILYSMIKTGEFERKEECLKLIENLMHYRKFADNINEYLLKVTKKHFPNYQYDRHMSTFLEEAESFFLKTNTKDILRNKRTQRMRVYYFKSIGIDLGDNYQDYESNDLKQYIPTRKQIEEYKKELEELQKIYSKALKMFDSNENEISQDLEKEGYLITKINKPGSKKSFCAPNIKKDIFAPICVFNLNNIIFNNEEIYFHEFIHCIDTVNMHKTGVRCEDEKHKYLNEAITDYTALKIYEDFVSEEGYLLNKNRRNIYSNYYEVLHPIGEAFCKKFKDNLFKIRFSNEEEMYKYVDENFLNELEKLSYGAFCEDFPESLRNAFIKKAVNMINEYEVKPNNNINK